MFETIRRGRIDAEPVLQNLHGMLAEQGRTRRIVIGVSNFATLLSILPNTDMISTVPDFVGKELLALGGLALDPVPYWLKSVANALVWRDTVDRDPAEIWFRDLLVSTLAPHIKDQ